jgi:hypothetical protein
MKLSRPITCNFLVFIAALAGFVFASSPRLFASAEDQVDSALAASKSWTAQIDAAQYDDSYAFGCQAMHDKVQQDQWGAVLKALRQPWGTLVDRKQVSHIYKGDGYLGSEGEFMVITYDTNFSRLNSVTEVVVLKWEDGKWRGAGYNAKIKPASDQETAGIPPPDSTTEVHTEEHMTPKAQSPSQ